jgi:hypothetical protein
VNSDTQCCRESSYFEGLSLDWGPSPMTGSFLRSTVRRALESARTPVYYGRLNLPTCYRKPLTLGIADSHKGFPMSKFAIGEQVDNAADDHEGGTVIAVFPTVDGNFRYAVDMEGYGALQFFTEEKLVVHVQRVMAW